MDRAALPDRLRDHCGNGALESRVIIRGHKLHPPQPPAFQVQENLFPTRLPLPVGQLYRQDLSPAGIVDLHRLAADYPVLPDLLVAGVQHQVGIGFLSGPLGKSLQALIQVLLTALMADAEKAWPHNASVMAFTFRVDTPWMYISAKADTSAFSDLWVSRQDLGGNCPCRSWGIRRSSFPTRPGHQSAAVIARAITQSPGTAFSFFSPNRVSHLLLQDLLEHLPPQLLQTVFLGAKNLLQEEPLILFRIMA